MKYNMDANPDWNNLYEKIIENLAKTKKALSENICNKPKDIGDRVMVWDGSDSEDIESGKSYDGIDKIFKDPLIIIEKGCINEHINCAGKKLNRDIVVYSPKYKRKIATCMEYVKLLD